MNCTKLKPELKDSIKERIKDHPCFCEKAHTRYSRMHLAVAPKCNIQCNYCNRKFDCVNESRPGVTSKVLTPEEAFERFKCVKSKINDLTVVGIAGPGDPLANIENTMKTFELIRNYSNNIRLCLSTNGLMLPYYIKDLVKLGVEHITITINTVDEKIGSKIYRFIKFNGKTYKGVEASEILYDRQLEGLRMAVSMGLIVKINTVLIPGINDANIPDISRMIKREGGFIHNIIPLINPADNSTYFAKEKVREPEAKEIEFARFQATLELGSISMVMKHCKQCRADAVGKLNEDYKI
jgi:nitrogen fixation protein NifB